MVKAKGSYMDSNGSMYQEFTAIDLVDAMSVAKRTALNNHVASCKLEVGEDTYYFRPVTQQGEWLKKTVVGHKVKAVKVK